MLTAEDVPDTSRIESFAIMKNSSSYFLGDANNDSLQRIYGVSFPDKKLMAAHKKFLEEAAKRDHRLIGKQQELFYFEEASPGSAMWLPHGMRIHNAIMNYIKEEYWDRGYDEVMTPNMFNVSLWEQSGHLAHYKEDMFLLDVDKEQFGLKPMNCPGMVENLLL
jgi:threonyl-tRNA synthetase